MMGRGQASNKADPNFHGEFVSYEQAIKTLEGADLSLRGSGSSQLLKRWLSLLKQLEILSAASTDYRGMKIEASKRSVAFVSYYHIENEGVQVNFCDVFLRIQVVPGVILSMNIISPTDTLHVDSLKVDELESWTPIADLCLKDKNVSYWRFGREKTTPSIVLYKVVDGKKVYLGPKVYEVAEREKVITTLESRQFCRRWARLLEEIEELCAHAEYKHKTSLRTEMTRKGVSECWDTFEHLQIVDGVAFSMSIATIVLTPKVNAQKVDELQVSKALLGNLSVKNGKCTSSTRFQGEETRLAEENEVAEIENEVAEITGLEAKIGELEALLIKVHISLAASYRRLLLKKEEVDSIDIGNTHSDPRNQNALVYIMAREFVLKWEKKSTLLEEEATTHEI